MHAQNLKIVTGEERAGGANGLTTAREDYAFLAAAKRGDSPRRDALQTV